MVASRITVLTISLVLTTAIRAQEIPAPAARVDTVQSVFLEASDGELLDREGIAAETAVLFEGYRNPEPLYEVRIFTVFVSSLHPSGVETPVRIQLFLPDAPADELAGAYLFAPGSTGLINPCRASREHEAGIRWGLYRSHVLAFAGAGFVGIIPDYQGYEDWDLTQPYFHAESEARVIQDAILGVDEFLRNAEEPEIRVPGGLSGLTRVASGFSQGGHAAFAAADRNVLLPEKLRLHGIIGYGSTTKIEPLLLEYPQVAPLIVQSFRVIYGSDRIDPYRILQREWADTLEYDTNRQCVGGIQSYYPESPSDIFHPGFLKSLYAGTLDRTHPEVAELFRENSAGISAHGVPALILQGTEDVVINRWDQDDFVIALRELGSEVKYYVYEGARHDTRQISFPAVVAWIKQLPR